MDFLEDLVQDMDETESWEFLAGHKLGRLGFHMVDQVEVLPINYKSVGKKIYFRTAEGSKLLGTLINTDVAFEVDEWEGTEARSVVIHGNCTELGEGPADAIREEIDTWIDFPKFHVMVIEPTRISGRRFQLSEDRTGDS